MKITRIIEHEFEELMDEICTNYCKYPSQYKDVDKMLEEVCDDCPFCE